MTSRALRGVAVPVVVAVAVLAVVLGIAVGVSRLSGSPDSGSSGAGSSGSIGSGSTGSPGSGSPGLDPAPDPGPDQPASRFTSVRRGVTDGSLDVRFWGGVEDCYRYTVGVEQTAEAVTLSLTETGTFDGPCIELAQQYDRTVPLDRALGGRAVLDATTGEVLLAPMP